ncbi:hypothetical protein AJ79_03829 [Helicocarpus griseus UAMH5409]|uniref:Uncharacterized protein n=1 Tax=Helicocarpus griseus UAMH5409 TaxID=1447875 RepID=A0A2B7XWX1_9EURO|nr:hypothetical protein AJ79_03829 [Helicocarpus griseus UAMH5409]
MPPLRRIPLPDSYLTLCCVCSSKPGHTSVLPSKYAKVSLVHEHLQWLFFTAPSSSPFFSPFNHRISASATASLSNNTWKRYTMSGFPSPKHRPCRPKAADSPCCAYDPDPNGPQDTFLEPSSLCLSTNGFIYESSCTDLTWQSIFGGQAACDAEAAARVGL